jgi:hypothetical protein
MLSKISDRMQEVAAARNSSDAIEVAGNTSIAMAMCSKLKAVLYFTDLFIGRN